MWGVSAAEAARVMQTIMTGQDPYIEPGCPYCGTVTARDRHDFCICCGAPPVPTDQLRQRWSEEGQR